MTLKEKCNYKTAFELSQPLCTSSVQVQNSSVPKTVNKKIYEEMKNGSNLSIISQNIVHIAMSRTYRQCGHCGDGDTHPLLDAKSIADNNTARGHTEFTLTMSLYRIGQSLLLLPLHLCLVVNLNISNQIK